MFKFSSIDSGVKCLEIVASVNMAKVTSLIITAIMISLRDLLPMVGLAIGMATSNAAGCNWVLFWDTLSTHTIQDELPCEMVKEEHATEYIFFANETWFCIKSLLLGHVMVMHIYCLIKGKSISPRTMNTDTVEWFFGDA